MRINKIKALMLWAVFFVVFGLIMVLKLPKDLMPWILIEIIVIYGAGFIFIDVIGE